MTDFEDKTEDIMRELASLVSSGGYNSAFDLDVFDAKITDGINHLYKVNDDLITENLKLRNELKYLQIEKYNLILSSLLESSSYGPTYIELIAEQNPNLIERLKKVI